MALAFRAGTSTVAANGTCAISTPAGTANGDILLAYVIETGTAAITAPAGWTRVDSQNMNSATTTSVGFMALYRKIWSTSDPTSYSWTSSSTYIDGYMEAYSGGDTTTPINAHVVQAPVAPVDIAVVATATGTGVEGTSFSITIPTSGAGGTVAAGHVAVATLAISGGSNVTVTGPSGWTSQKHLNSVSSIVGETWTKVLVSGDLTSTVSWTWTGTQTCGGGMAVYKNVDQTTPVHAVSTGSVVSAGGPNITSDSLTTTIDACRILHCHAYSATPETGLTFTTPTSYTAELTGLSARSTVANNDAEAYIADIAQATAGATGTTTSTASAGTNTYAAWHVALKRADVGSTSFTVPSITPTVTNTMEVSFDAFWAGTTESNTVTYPAGWTKQMSSDGSTSGHRILAASGTTGTGTGSVGSSLNHGSLVVALAPPSGNISASDSATLSESASVVARPNATDSATLANSAIASTPATPSATDSASQTTAQSVAAKPNATDSIALSESVSRVITFPSTPSTFNPGITPTSATEIPNAHRGEYQWYGYAVQPPGWPFLDCYTRYWWFELEPTQGNYDFSKIDTELANAEARGGTFGFRFMALSTGDPGLQSGGVRYFVPSAMWPNTTNYVVFGATYGVPNWNTDAYLTRVEAMMSALANHITSKGVALKNDPRLAHMDISGYGNWGEFHDYPYLLNPSLTNASADRIIAANVNNFPDCYFAIPTSHTYALNHAISNSNGMCGVRVDMIGDAGMGGAVDYLNQAGATALNAWKLAPAWGEWAAWTNGTVNNGQPASGMFATGLSEASTYHIAEISSSNYSPAAITSWPAQSQADYAAANKASGYRVQISQVRLDSLTAGSAASCSIDWQNVGVSPPYGNWQVAIQLRATGTTNVVWEGASTYALSSWHGVQGLLPTAAGAVVTSTDSWTIPANLTSGTYDFAVVIKNLRGIYTPMRIANTTTRASDGAYVLGSVTVSGSGAPLPPTPPAGGGTSLPAYSTAVLQDSPLAYWRLDDTSGTSLADATGNGHTLTATSGVTLQQSGIVPSSVAARFANAVASSNLNLSAYSTVTLEFFLNWDVYAGDDHLAFEYSGAATHFDQVNGFIIDPNSSVEVGKLEASIGTTTGTRTVGGGIARPTAGAWHHHVYVLDRTTPAITAYIDGQPVSFTYSAQNATAGTFGANTLYVMSRQGTGAFGAGVLDEIAIYPTALSASRVLAHYNAIVAAPAPTADYGTVTELGYWTDGTPNPTGNAGNTWNLHVGLPQWGNSSITFTNTDLPATEFSPYWARLDVDTNTIGLTTERAELSHGGQYEPTTGGIGGGYEWYYSHEVYFPSVNQTGGWTGFTNVIQWQDIQALTSPPVSLAIHMRADGTPFYHACLLQIPGQADLFLDAGDVAFDVRTSWTWHIKFAQDTTGFVELWRRDGAKGTFTKVVTQTGVRTLQNTQVYIEAQTYRTARVGTNRSYHAAIRRHTAFVLAAGVKTLGGTIAGTSTISGTQRLISGIGVHHALSFQVQRGVNYHYRVKSTGQGTAQSVSSDFQFSVPKVAPSTAYASAIFSAGPVAYWRMDDTGPVLVDQFGTNNGTYSTTGYTLGVPGAILGDTNAAARFDGLTGAASAPVSLGTSSVCSLVYWANWDVFADNDHIAFEFSPNINGNNGFLINPNSAFAPGRMQISMRDASGITNAVSAARPTAAAYHMIVVVLDRTQASAANQIAVYVDGVAQLLTPVTTGVTSGSFGANTLYMMARAGTSLLAAGALDEVALFDRVVTATEVNNWYQLATPATVIPPPPGPPAPPIIVVPQPAATAATATAIVEVALSANPNQTPVWVDISGYVESLSYSRGRQRELDHFQAGTAQISLLNGDRRFDPTFAGSPYYPNLLPMRRIRIRAVHDGVVYPRWSGYVESWGQSWRSWADAVVTVSAVDAFKPLNLAQLNGSFPAQSSSDRINAALDLIGWTIGGPAWTVGTSTLNSTTVVGPTGDRVVTAGLSSIQAVTLANTPALQHMQEVEATELGQLYTDSEGAVVFYGRQRAVLPSQLASQATFGELELPYVDVELDYDDTDVWNDVRLTPTNGVETTAADTQSQGQYFLRTLSRTTLHNTPLEVQSQANVLVNRYAQPKLQITSLTLDGEVDPDHVYPHMFGRELGDRVTVRRRPLAGGAPIEQVSLIQGIAMTFDAASGLWTTVWRLSPADPNTYWIVGDTTASVLGSTTRVFY